MNKIKVAFVCVHNSCRSQIAEALGKKYLSDICECYSAGMETKPQINRDAVRLMKQIYGIDMDAEQYSKLFADIPETDIVGPRKKMCKQYLTNLDKVKITGISLT